MINKNPSVPNRSSLMERNTVCVPGTGAGTQLQKIGKIPAISAPFHWNDSLERTLGVSGGTFHLLPRGPHLERWNGWRS